MTHSSSSNRYIHPQQEEIKATTQVQTVPLGKPVVVCGGKDCGSTRRTSKDLRAHVRFQHGARHLLRLITRTNECPWRHSYFASRAAAQNHVISAVNNGTCEVDQQHFQVELCELQGDDLRCPLLFISCSRSLGLPAAHHLALDSSTEDFVVFEARLPETYPTVAHP